MKPRKLYKIGEVIKFSGLSRQTLHNYTVRELIAPLERTDSGHRLYAHEVFERIKKIERWKAHRTLEEVKRLLDEEDAAGAGASPANPGSPQGVEPRDAR
ncbi:MAG: MerR family DNA-binding transcriptional regulator [Planctomycetes bacterium]|nr:MerR family DNA-binding transcriptional regulator [Planctomycetota bacterium]